VCRCPSWIGWRSIPSDPSIWGSSHDWSDIGEARSLRGECREYRSRGDRGGCDSGLTHAVIVTLAALGIAGQVLAAVLLAVGLLALFGVRAPLALTRSLVWGSELWLTFIVAAVATGGSLYF